MAEHLFAEKGFPTVTMREIASKAKVSLSALPYYFGSKIEILQVLERRFGPIQKARISHLSDAVHAAQHSPERVRRILKALLLPVFGEMRGQRDFTRLMGALSLEPNPDVRAVVDDVLARHPTGIPEALREAMSHLNEEEFIGDCIALSAP